MNPLTKRQILKRLAKGKNFSRTILKYADLREFDLSRGNFYRADLEGADLEGADMVRAQCLEVNLEGANMIDICGCEAYLEDANLYRADCEGADFRRADFKGANLRDANLNRSSFERADCERFQVAGAQMNQANFSFADCRAGNFSRVQAERALLCGANLTEASLKEADFRMCNFSGADLSNADCEGADFRGAVFHGAKLDGAILDGCRLERALIDRGVYPGLSARWVDFSPSGDGRDRFEFGKRELHDFLDDRYRLDIEFEGVLSTEVLGGIHRFLAIMETILPQFSVTTDTVRPMLTRTIMSWKLGSSAEPAVYSFMFFLIYQFANGDNIDCSLLETLIIEARSPILASVLVKKRPLSADLIKQILKMKKVMKVDSLFFQSRLLTFRYVDRNGAVILMTDDETTANSGHEYKLVREQTELLS